MPIGMLGQLLIGIALSFLGYLLMPKPKPEPPPSMKDYDNPTCEAGRPIPVIFGSIKQKGPNIIWYGDKSIQGRPPRKEEGGKFGK